MHLLAELFGYWGDHQGFERESQDSSDGTNVAFYNPPTIFCLCIYSLCVVSTPHIANLPARQKVQQFLWIFNHLSSWFLLFQFPRNVVANAVIWRSTPATSPPSSGRRKHAASRTRPSMSKLSTRTRSCRRVAAWPGTGLPSSVSFLSWSRVGTTMPWRNLHRWSRGKWSRTLLSLPVPGSRRTPESETSARRVSYRQVV